MLSLSLPFAAIILLGMILAIALPNFQRPDNLFSVIIAPESRHHPEVRALITRWRISNAVIGLVGAGAGVAAAATSPPFFSFSILPVCLLTYPILPVALYVVFHRQALAFTLPGQGAATRVATLRPRPVGTLIPSQWKLVPLCVIALTVALLIIRYSNAPTVIPIHFDLTGHANRFAPKSIWTFLHTVGLQLSVWVILTLFGRSLSVSRVTPSTGAMAEAYRHRWVRLVFVIKTVIVILLGITDLLTTSKLPPGALAEPLATLAMALNVAILTLMLTLALRDGQSGWRQCRRAGLHMTPYGDATPDSAWKGGVFYYNPDDPALFVEKRSGLGGP